MRFKKTLISGVIIHVAMLHSFCVSQNSMNGPGRKINSQTYEEYGHGNNFILNIYQKWISPIKGNTLCPMYPSCSQYSKIAFDKYSEMKAFSMSCDRILRCGHELNLYKQIQVNDRIQFYDPVPENVDQGKNERYCQ